MAGKPPMYVDHDTTDDELSGPEPRYAPDGHIGKSGKELDDWLAAEKTKRHVPPLPPITDD